MKKEKLERLSEESLQSTFKVLWQAALCAASKEQIVPCLEREEVIDFIIEVYPNLPIKLLLPL